MAMCTHGHRDLSLTLAHARRTLKSGWVIFAAGNCCPEFPCAFPLAFHVAESHHMVPGSFIQSSTRFSVTGMDCRASSRTMFWYTPVELFPDSSSASRVIEVNPWVDM